MHVSGEVEEEKWEEKQEEGHLCIKQKNSKLLKLWLLHWLSFTMSIFQMPVI